MGKIICKKCDGIGQLIWKDDKSIKVMCHDCNGIGYFVSGWNEVESMPDDEWNEVNYRMW